jgi:hypothetical protein
MTLHIHRVPLDQIVLLAQAAKPDLRFVVADKLRGTRHLVVDLEFEHIVIALISVDYTDASLDPFGFRVREMNRI